MLATSRSGSRFSRMLTLDCLFSVRQKQPVCFITSCLLVLWEHDNGDLVDQKLQIGKADLRANEFLDYWFQGITRCLGGVD